MMQIIRSEMRSHRMPGLSVPQFRTLVFVDRKPGASLSDVAQYLGSALPPMSKLVDGLVAKDLILRDPCKADRRCVTLRLTKHGQMVCQAARTATEAHLQDFLSRLPARDCAKVIDVMLILSALLDPASTEARAKRK
jgi:DNA-binding MarR family transcriptional regulator